MTSSKPWLFGALASGLVACGGSDDAAGGGAGGVASGGAAGSGSVSSGGTAGVSGGSGGIGGSSGSSGSGSAGGQAGAPTNCATTPTPVPGSSGKSLIVASDGDDAAGDGSLQKPFRSLKKACGLAAPGDAIELRGGTWSTALETCGAKGSADHPVHIRPHAGEQVVFDAAGKTLSSSQHVIQLSGASWVVLDGIEVKNSEGRGVGYYDSSGVTLRNLKIHDVKFRALGGGGDDIVMENNEIWNASLTNENNSAGGSGWPGVIQTYMKPDDTPSKNVVIRNNYVHDAWGECVIALFADGVVIEGNQLRDCYSVSLYVDNSKNVSILRNQIWTTTSQYDKNGGHASGITFASENYAGSEPKQAVENLLVANNVITDTGMGISRWQDPANTATHNTWKDVKILHNVIRGATKVSLYVESVGSAPAPTGGQIANNVIWKGTQGALSLEDPSAWQVGPNAWPDGKPALDANAASFAGDPGMTAPTSAADPEGFELGPSSACKGKGVAAPPVLVDFWCAPRSATAPSLGIHEP